MQLVSLSDLKKLASQSISESTSTDVIGYGLSFKDVSRVYAQQKSTVEDKLGKEYFQKNWPLAMSSWMKLTYLVDKCPPITLVGDGSSRTAYACLGGKCLKVAKNLAGVAQNKQEEKHTKKRWWSNGYRCFAQTYGSSKDYGLLLSECCAKVESDQHLVESFGMDSIDVFRAVIKAVGDDKKHDVSSASSTLKNMSDDYMYKGKDFKSMLSYAKTAESAAAWLDNFGKGRAKDMSPGQKSFYALVLFWKARGTDELLPGDVAAEDNWGFAIRDGQIAPVMLDVGFSREVAKTYYGDVPSKYY